MTKFSKNVFLSKKWCDHHLQQIKQLAGPRYAPLLNVELPISKIFDGISRTKSFYGEIREQYGKLNRCIQNILRDLNRASINKDEFSEFEKQSKILVGRLSEIKEFNVKRINWGIIHNQTLKLLDLCIKLLSIATAKKTQAASKDDKEKIDFLSHSIFDAQKILYFFESYSEGVKAKLSNDPFLILLGEAGSGKTHLLCDLISSRFGADGTILPAVMVLGEQVDCVADIIPQAIRRFGLKTPKMSEDKFWQSLNDAGKQAGCKALFILDAANEMLHLKSGKKLIASLHEKVCRYKYIAIVVSIRNGFESLFLRETKNNKFIITRHHGFKDVEWRAITIFFSLFKIRLPEVPLLTPEFQNPLFLHLFCKAFQRQVRNHSRKRKKMIYRGHEGATYIFEQFVKSVADRLAVKYKLPPGRSGGQYVIWDTIIEKIACKMAEGDVDRVAELEVVKIIRDSHPNRNHMKLLKDLETNMLLTKIPEFNVSTGEILGFKYRFPFQKFSDHLISRYIFKMQSSSGKTPEQFFSPDTQLGMLLQRSSNCGLVGALMIECPERLGGKEFFDVAPYLRQKYYAAESFIESLIWRKPESFEFDHKSNFPERTRKLLHETIKENDGFYYLLNAFITIASCPNHPFNAKWLHRWLWAMSMPKRDSIWSVFLHRQHGQETSVDRLLEWAWSKQDKSHVGDEPLFLLCVILAWFLTTSNRAVRDKATKGLVCLLTNRLDLLLSLLAHFEHVNDPYVAERLYAVAYGCVLRNYADPNGTKNLAEWIYEHLFSTNRPPAHILLRDYARGVIEVAMRRKIKISIKENHIWPPYKSDWIGIPPSEEQLKEKYNPEKESEGSKGMWRIWWSVIGGGDFDRYVIGTNSNYCAWSGRRFGKKEIDRKAAFEIFLNNLDKKQKQLWDKANPIICEEPANEYAPDNFLRFKVAVGRKTEVESQIALQRFKRSLGPRKANYYEKKIAPFLDSNLNLKYNPADRFDLRIAQRWILKRVYELGWQPELHGEFDSDVDSVYNRGRKGKKPERIGKKYQWIAYREFLAKLSDHFELAVNSWVNPEVRQVYRGPWNPFARDIDPSFVEKPEIESNYINLRKWETHFLRYDAWEKKEPDREWIKKRRNIPCPSKVILFKDDNDTEWLFLDGFIKWEEEIPPEEDKYNISRREIWYMIKSYIVKNEHAPKTIAWAQKQRFMGRWMPESHDFYELFLGEYPNSSAYEETRPDADRWIHPNDRYKELPNPVMLTNDDYLNETSWDCSLSEGCSIKLPSKYLVNAMKLVQLYSDGRFFDEKSELVASPISIWRNAKLNGLAMRKDKLVALLKESDTSVFWAFLGEKNVLAPLYEHKKDGFSRCELSGAYFLNRQKAVHGSFSQFSRGEA